MADERCKNEFHGRGKNASPVVGRGAQRDGKWITVSNRRNLEFNMVKSFLVMAVAFVIALSPASAYAAITRSKNEGIKANKIEGRITAVDTNTGAVTILTSAGKAVVVKTNASTKIERNGVRAKLGSIKVGDRAKAIVVANRLASKLESTGP